MDSEPSKKEKDIAKKIGSGDGSTNADCQAVAPGCGLSCKGVKVGN